MSTNKINYALTAYARSQASAKASSGKNIKDNTRVFVPHPAPHVTNTDTNDVKYSASLISAPLSQNAGAASSTIKSRMPSALKGAITKQEGTTHRSSTHSNGTTQDHITAKLAHTVNEVENTLTLIHDLSNKIAASFREILHTPL